MELYYCIGVLDRSRADRFIRICSECELPATIAAYGIGTATGRQLERLGLERTDKTIVALAATAERRAKLFSAARSKMLIDIPGNGILLSVPIKSVGGEKTLNYLTGKAKGNDSKPAMLFSHELILVIINQGFIDEVMDAARAAGAGGGTVIHARGTGAKYAKKFLGVSLAEEREVIMIVASSSEKNKIMKAIADSNGIGTPAGAITFSIPVSNVIGLRSNGDDASEL